jgi:FtsP/CotA-like multicopper oxidase with cupredoxin domain
VLAPQDYVHHCHIVEHEDNDMMRPFTVMPVIP